MSSSPSPSFPPQPAPDARLLFGPILIGVLLNTMLYGVMLVQMFMYYTRYSKRDSKWTRLLILYLLIVETADVVFEIGFIFEPLIVYYGSARALENTPLFLKPGASGGPTTTVAISTAVQLFVAWRIETLTEAYLFPVLISVLSLVSLGGGISVTYLVASHDDFAFALSPKFHPFVTTWLSSSAACDVIMSAVLIYSLYTRKTGTSPTDRYVDRIIRLTVQTGSITAVTAMVDLLVFLLKPPNTALQFIWDLPLSKLYTNALLSTLNARPWTEETAYDNMNALFEFEQPTNNRSGQINSVVGSYPPIELQHRRREISTLAFNGNSGTSITADLESGFGGEEGKTPPP
ncbi:F-box domain-containing protein [Mycena venus]|uniref:F-box domain-containing protein n=1 Tax=Mycena venus TaxID=2733690 RepID=A0A8H6XEF0_9AGAR|nr:F-box domain-containing protein [Mycena venus]